MVFCRFLLWNNISENRRYDSNSLTVFDISSSKFDLVATGFLKYSDNNLFIKYVLVFSMYKYDMVCCPCLRKIAFMISHVFRHNSSIRSKYHFSIVILDQERKIGKRLYSFHDLLHFVRFLF